MYMNMRTHRNIDTSTYIKKYDMIVNMTIEYLLASIERYAPFDTPEWPGDRGRWLDRLVRVCSALAWPVAANSF